MKRTSRLALSILIVLVTMAMTMAGRAGAASPDGAGDPTRIYYGGEPGAVLAALKLIPAAALVQDPVQADVLVLNGAIPDLPAVQSRREQGAGVVLIFGPQLTAEAVSSLAGASITFTTGTDALSLAPAAGIQDALIDQVVWTSAPQVRERAVIHVSGPIVPLVKGFEDGSLVLARLDAGRGALFLFAPYLNKANPQVQEWAYFNYLVYNLVMRAANKTPLSFADYPAAPVPHKNEQVVLYILLLFLLAGAAFAFLLVRRYSRLHPEALDSLVADRARYVAREADTDWEEIGFHRPLGGFLLALFFGFVLFVPLIIYQNLILPAYILPSAQALGIWGRVTQFFNLLWLFLDMGTSMAFVKYFSQYRVHDPRRAILYGQVFVWWQTLSGAVQVALMVALAGTLLPNSVYAIYTWSVIIHTFIQIPGFYQVMRHALTGIQRFDYAQVLDLGLAVIFPMLAQPVFVSLMVVWGRSQPVFGAAMGGLLGMGVAAYAVELLTFGLGLFLYRRLGYGARVYFLAHFDFKVIKEAFQFGVFEMLGSAAWGVGQSIEILITQTRLVNYAEVWGNWVLAQNFVFAYNVISTLYNNLVPSISEAISHGRRILSQYYVASAYKWGGMMSAMLAAILLAVADRFILGASGPEFVRAAGYAVPLLIWGAIQYPSWVGDNVQRGANRPGLITVMIVMEQLIRIGLAFLLVEKLQINALILAYFVGLLTKGIVSYFINDRFCFRQRFYFWQSLMAPVLAGAVHYLILRWVGGLIWRGDQLTSILIFFIAILPSFPIYAFFYGLFGGWDQENLAELQRAVSLSSFMRPLAWLFWAATNLGASLSPLHNRFPIRIRQSALNEAASLARERVSLLKEEPEHV